VVLAVQNLGPCRRQWEPGPGWRVTARLDGLDDPVAGSADRVELGPWDLGFWRLERAAAESSQSS
jgi:hypothetical protein